MTTASTTDLALMAHLLRRAGFGADRDELERYSEKSYDDVVEDLLKRTRDTGVMVGFSCHNPQMIEIAEERGWDVDFYMTSMYYVNRTPAMYRKILGEDLPHGEKYLPSDPPKMCKMIRQTRKPCLAFKTLAAGRTSNSPAAIRQSLAWVYDHIKPTDALILGMYNQESDQAGQDAEIVRSILTSTTG